MNNGARFVENGDGLEIIPPVVEVKTTDSLVGLTYFARRLREFFQSETDSLVEYIRDIFTQEEQRHRKSFQNAVRATFSVDISPVLRSADVAAHVDAATLQSVNYIRGMTDESAKRLVGVLAKGAAEGMRSAELAKQLAAEFNWSKKRARLIARDQTATFNGTLNRVRQQQVGVEQYEWSTSLDERVRKEHAHREGKIFSWGNPPPDGHPGEPINCRCVARAVIV